MALDKEWKEQYDYMTKAEQDQYDRYFQQVMNANTNSAQAQMNFQERMSNTAHQREVKDLIKAGLNPVLSANNGAASPAGAYANVDSSPLSAKFARQQANAEMENQRRITSMQTDNAWQIAAAQMANQAQMNKYTTDANNKTSRFNTIVEEYGVFAGLAYGIAEDIFNGLEGGADITEQAENLLGLHNKIEKGVNTAKEASDSAQSYIDKAREYLEKTGWFKSQQEDAAMHAVDKVLFRGERVNNKFIKSAKRKNPYEQWKIRLAEYKERLKKKKQQYYNPKHSYL